MKTNSDSIDSYSKDSSPVYEDATNKGFVYGRITNEFLKKCCIKGNSQLLDVGSGTGFVFEFLEKELKEQNVTAIGVEPAHGMREVAEEKFSDLPHISFKEGRFEKLPLKDHSVDTIVSTLALHWVDDIETAVSEMSRVLIPDGQLDILMIAHDDGAQFKRHVFQALKKHLSFGEAMKTAALVQRRKKTELEEIFNKHFPNSQIVIENPKAVDVGTFEKHMKWWKARSQSILTQIENPILFLSDLEKELTDNYGDKIPFDSSVFEIRLGPKEG